MVGCWFVSCGSNKFENVGERGGRGAGRLSLAEISSVALSKDVLLKDRLL